MRYSDMVSGAEGSLNSDVWNLQTLSVSFVVVLDNALVGLAKGLVLR